jgi:hypothetical protein
MEKDECYFFLGLFFYLTRKKNVMFLKFFLNLLITFFPVFSNADKVDYQNTFLNVHSKIQVDTNSDTSKFWVKGFLWKKEGTIYINGSVFKIDDSFDSFLKKNNIYIESVRFVEYDSNIIVQSLYNHIRNKNEKKVFAIADEIRVDVRMPLIGRRELSFLPEHNLAPHLFREEEKR